MVESNKYAEDNRMQNEMISIVVPIYNVEQYLKSCVDSILSQTYRNTEIILVDDGSPDNCPRICDEYAKKDERIRVIHQKNKGLSGARNTGIDNARGEYLIFVDSDDTIEHTMVEELYGYALKNDCAMVACGRNYVFEDGQIVCKITDEVNQVYNFEDAMYEMNTFTLFDMSAWAKIYKKELFSNIRFPEGKLSEDYYIAFKLIDLAQAVGYVAKPLYNYLQRQSSISRNKKINHDFAYAAKEQMEYLDKKYPELSVLGHTAYASANLTVYDFYIKNGVKCPKEKLAEFKNAVKDNLEYIRKNSRISKAKRIQFELFAINVMIYNIVFVLYRKMRRV